MLGGEPEITRLVNWVKLSREDTSSLSAGRMSLGGGMTAALRE